MGILGAFVKQQQVSCARSCIDEACGTGRIDRSLSEFIHTMRRFSMPTTLPSGINGTTGTASRLQALLLAGYGLAVVVVCGLLVINGPQIRAAAEAREAQIIDGENKAFCSKLGVGPETARYAQCASELAQIRARHLKRYLSDSIL
jgi:hypothetical protein